MPQSSPAGTDPRTAAARWCAALLMAQFVSGRAVRDALYLANLPVTTLPTAMLVTAVASILLALVWPRLSSGTPPARFLSRALVISGILFAVESALYLLSPVVAAIAVYLQVSVLGPSLGSALWLITTEQYDPRSARRAFGRIVTAGAAGGLAGSIVAERVATTWGVPWVLPMMGAASLLTARYVMRLGTLASQSPSSSDPRDAPTSAIPGLSVLARVRFLRHLALLVLLGALTAGLLDYLFKSMAVATLGSGASLVRFFSWYYALSAAAIIAVQMLMQPAVLERFGVARTVMAPAAAALAGAAAAWMAPGLAALTVTRAAESVLRGSLFRSAYEIFFTPVSSGDKRAAKSVIDVAFDRAGDAAAAVLLTAVLATTAPHWQARFILALVIAASAGALLVALRLAAGYVTALERRLREHAFALSLDDVQDRTTRAVLWRTLVTRGASGAPAVPPAAERARVNHGWTPDAVPDVAAIQILALRSGHPARIARVLDPRNRLVPALVPHVIPLLDDPHHAAAAARAVAPVAAAHAGVLTEAMLDRRRSPRLRRRVARILGSVPRRPVVDGLLRVLRDPDFTVRVESGRALAGVRALDGRLAIEPGPVHAAVLEELARGRAAWDEHHSLADGDGDDAEGPDEYVGQRTHEALAHVFRLLSVVLPPEPLRIAYRGLHTDDDVLRGTALEYLDTVLPTRVKEALWPYIDGDGGRRAGPVDRSEALTRLVAAHPAILTHLTRTLSAPSRDPGRLRPRGT